MIETADKYVIFWYADTASGEKHYETFETLADAQLDLAEWANLYPWNRYVLAKIIGEQVPAQERRPRHPSAVTLTAVSGPGATCVPTIVDGVITAVTITRP